MEKLHPRDSRFEDLAGFPKAGAFVHVLVEPLTADGEVQALAELDELRVESSEKREDFLEEVKGHEVGREERVVEVVELVGEELVEAMEGGGTHLRAVAVRVSLVSVGKKKGKEKGGKVESFYIW